MNPQPCPPPMSPSSKQGEGDSTLDPRPSTLPPVAVYVHTPFCPSKCGYCDFNSYAMDGEIIDRTVRAMETEIRNSPWRGRAAKTIFFGGGTPTFLSDSQLCGLLDAVLEVHPPIEGAEITSEANPGTVDIPKFKSMRAAGFNRISLGAQSFQREDLIRLGRVHRESEIGRAVGAAREAGLENLNLDLMFALPGQSLSAWERNLELAVSLKPEHLSLYCLTIEPNTRFYKLHQRGMLDLPDDECQVAMYDLACSFAASAGFEQYEISNFAREGFESRHNLCYWRCEEYLGYGPGAVGCVDFGLSIGACGLVRYTNLKHPERYSAAVEELGSGLRPSTLDPRPSLWCESETLDDSTRKLERIMMGIRLREGLSTRDLDLVSINRLVSRGWIDASGDLVTLTPAGRHFCSEVALELA